MATKHKFKKIKYEVKERVHPGSCVPIQVYQGGASCSVCGKEYFMESAYNPERVSDSELRSTMNMAFRRAENLECNGRT